MIQIMKRMPLGRFSWVVLLDVTFAVITENTQNPPVKQPCRARERRRSFNRVRADSTLVLGQYPITSVTFADESFCSPSSQFRSKISRAPRTISQRSETVRNRSESICHGLYNDQCLIERSESQNSLGTGLPMPRQDDTPDDHGPSDSSVSSNHSNQTKGPNRHGIADSMIVVGLGDDTAIIHKKTFMKLKPPPRAEHPQSVFPEDYCDNHDDLAELRKVLKYCCRPRAADPRPLWKRKKIYDGKKRMMKRSQNKKSKTQAVEVSDFETQYVVLLKAIMKLVNFDKVKADLKLTGPDEFLWYLMTEPGIVSTNPRVSPLTDWLKVPESTIYPESRTLIKRLREAFKQFRPHLAKKCHNGARASPCRSSSPTSNGRETDIPAGLSSTNDSD